MNGSVQLERADLPFLYLFVVFGPSVGWMVSTHIGEDDHLYSVYQFKCSSGNSLTDTPSKVCSPGLGDGGHQPESKPSDLLDS